MGRLLFFFLFSVSLAANAQIQDHPRILLTATDEDRLRDNLQTNNDLKSVNDWIITVSDQIIGKETLTYRKEGRRLLEVSREALKRIFYLSYAYRMTNEPSYLHRAEQEMLAVCAFPDWNPSHFLDVGEMAMAVAIGYDWLYSNLQASSKAAIKESIIDKAFLPSKQSDYNGFLVDRTNKNQVCNAGLTLAALAIYDEAQQESEEMITRGINSLQLPTDAYAPDGAYPEGYQYWFYGTTFQVVMLASLESAFGEEVVIANIDSFYKTAEYILYMTGPQDQVFNFSDSGSPQRPNMAMFWFAGKTNNESLLYWEKKLLNKGAFSKPYSDDRLLPALICLGNTSAFGAVSPPQAASWIGHGTTPVALFHTNWGQDKAQYLAIKGGKATTTHAHLDAGSFVYDSDGLRWAIDLGLENYAKIEDNISDFWDLSQHSGRWDLFRYNNKAHNTLTINDKKHQVEGKAEILETFDDEDGCGAKIDLTPVFSQEVNSVFRTVSLKEQDFYCEDVICTNDTQAGISWRMATPATATVVDEQAYIVLQRNGKVKYLTVESPCPVVLKQWPTTPQTDYESSNAFASLVGFETTLPPERECTLKVTLSSTHPSPEGLIQNGGFEEVAWLPAGLDVILADDGIWRHRKVNNERIGTGYVTDEAHAGSASLKLHLDELPANVADFKWYYNYVYQKVRLDSSKKYALRFWAKGNYQAQAVLYVKNGTTLTGIAGAPKTGDLSADWTQYTLILDIPAHLPDGITPEMVVNNTILCLAMPNSSKNSPAHTVWIDDVQLYEWNASNLSDTPARSETDIYIEGNRVYFDLQHPSLVSVFDATGRLLFSKMAASGAPLVLPRAGSFLLNIRKAGGEENRKITIR